MQKSNKNVDIEQKWQIRSCGNGIEMSKLDKNLEIEGKKMPKLNKNLEIRTKMLKSEPKCPKSKMSKWNEKCQNGAKKV